MSKFCAHCGKPIPDAGKFCPSCGKPLPPASAQPICSTPPAQPPVAPFACDPIPEPQTEPLWHYPAAPKQQSTPEPAPYVAPAQNPAPTAPFAPSAPARTYVPSPAPTAKKTNDFSTRYGVLSIIAVALMGLGILIGFFTGEIELISTTVYNGEETPVGIGLHVFVVMLIFLASNVLYFIANYKETLKKLTAPCWLFHGSYVLAGLFLALATGFSARADLILEYSRDMNSAPVWYSGDIVGQSWFWNLSGIASDFATYASICYVLMILALGATITFYLLTVNALKKAKESQL
ncbi:MAG: hypothetical protein IJW62_02000 [Clostridia bacterium]|nr:hypothetical protein [Clostridia bacterium]